MPALGRVHPSNRGTHTSHQCQPCVLCNHPSAGPPLHGSPNVFVNGTPALRATGLAGSPPDGGTHDAGQCCGNNKWVCALAPNRGVRINGILAFCDGDQTQHDQDGKFGNLRVSGKQTVFVGGG